MFVNRDRFLEIDGHVLSLLHMAVCASSACEAQLLTLASDSLCHNKRSCVFLICEIIFLSSRKLFVISNIFISSLEDTHLSIQTIDLAKNNGVVMLTLPSHCSHKMQPLDFV